MTAFIIGLCILLLVIVIMQVSKLSDLYARIRGEEEVDERLNRNQGRAMMLFMVGLLVLSVVSSYWWKNYMMGYGPHKSASAHGGVLDDMFNITLVFTGIVFILTHIALFYFAWKYKKKRGSKAIHWAHNNTLEIVWSAIPAVVMTYLVIKGLLAWNTVMADVAPGEDHIEIEATGYQFAWHLRYPGADGVLGSRDFRKITAVNPLGQDWTDAQNFDDFHPNELWLPVNKKVRVRIIARDVLHNFYLAHFRVKMDAVPGLPTYFVFTPTKTTEEYRDVLRNYPEYNVPKDPKDPESKMLWETFNYELACAELCGKSHYSMRRIVRIVTQEAYDAWLLEQQSYYVSSIRGTDSDPNVNKLLGYEITRNRDALKLSVEKAFVDTGLPTEDALKTISLDFITYEPGTSKLTDDSKYQLEDLAAVLIDRPQMKIEIRGYADSTVDPAANRALSQQRADGVRDFLISKEISSTRLSTIGLGTTPSANDTDAARQKKSIIEFKIL